MLLLSLLPMLEGSRAHGWGHTCYLCLFAYVPSDRTSEKLVKAPREGCATGPSGRNCLLCMCALDIDTAGARRAFVEHCVGWLLAVPGSLSPSLLQTVPRPLGLSPPHISPRCCLLRLGHLPRSAAVQGRVRPRAATGESAGETLPVLGRGGRKAGLK